MQLGVVDPARSGDVELYVLEARLFENMCALFNLAFDRQAQLPYPRTDKIELKTTIALELAVVSAAFQCLEAYLNGLAFDFVMRVGLDTLDAQTKALLTEWDYKADRQRFVSFRDKLLKYPRIVTGEDHPLLQENNCAALRILLENAKPLRDALTHASPFDDPGSSANKLQAVFQCSFEQIEEIVDAITSLISQIETAVFGSSVAVDWIRSRAESGRFPVEVFS
jgi:hypothetical protein